MINFKETSFTNLDELLEWKEEVDRLVEREKEKAYEEKALLNIEIVSDIKDKDFLRRSLINKWLKTCNIEEFDKSEETESGAFGVHIVFDRKKEFNI